jgi:hypothetical protein
MQQDPAPQELSAIHEEEMRVAECAYNVFVEPTSKKREDSPPKTFFGGIKNWLAGNKDNSEEKRLIVTETAAALLEKMRQEDPKAYEAIKLHWTSAAESKA